MPERHVGMPPRALASPPCPAVLARTILAGCRQVTVTLRADGRTARDDGTGNGAGGSAGARRILSGMLELDGTPHLIGAPGCRLPIGPVRLTCYGPPTEPGRTVLEGRAHPMRAATAVPALVEALSARCGCPADPRGPELDVSRLPVAPVDVERVEVAAAATAGEPVSTLTVPLAQYRRAAPDLWRLHGPEVAAHVQTHHHGALLDLVEASAYPTAVVAVTGLRADGMTLACLGTDGVTEVVVPFDPPVTDRAALGRWLDRRADGHRAC